MKKGLKVGISGVRGVVGESFTPQLAASFAMAFGSYVRSGAVMVGRDTRPSGKMIEHAVVAGLQSVGCKPVLAGVIPTPTLLILTQNSSSRGGIAITASHNPAPWNALKFVDHSGMFLNQVCADELFDIYHQQDFPLVNEQQIQSVTYELNPMEEHYSRVLDLVNREQIASSGIRVAVDCCNGVGALHTVPFLERLGCDVVAIHHNPDIPFERGPEPVPEHISALCDVVVKEGCDIGFAQDPDGDRLAVVNEKGVPIGEDLSLALAAEQVLTCYRKGPVVANLSTSRSIDYVAKKHECEVIRSRIGEIHVVEQMIASHAVVGGESNGGVILPQVHLCRDSYGGMAVLLELMARTGRRVSELRAEIPEYVMLKEKMHIRSEHAPLILRSLRRRYQSEKILLLDGVYVDFGDAWIHVRRSNTEPVIRLTAEGPDEDRANQLMGSLKDEIQEIVAGINEMD